MKQSLIIFIAMLAGLSTAYFTDGFVFSPFVCILAGIFLVMPSLFQFTLKDFLQIKEYKKILLLNFGINFLLIPTIALGIGYASQDIGIAAALFLLSLMPGGGMVMHWIKKSGANIKLGLILFAINIAMLLPVFFVFNYFQQEASPYFPANTCIIEEQQKSCAIQNSIVNIFGEEEEQHGVKPFVPFFLLILLPFLLSRFFLKVLPEVPGFFEKHKNIIANTTLSLIVFYLLGLETSKNLFTVSQSTLLTALGASVVFYIILFIVAKTLVLKDKDEQALFWHTSTRYITLGIAVSSFYTPIYGPSFLLPFIFAYFIQINTLQFITRKK